MSMEHKARHVTKPHKPDKPKKPKKPSNLQCSMRYALQLKAGKVVGTAEGFRDPESPAGCEDDLNACHQVNAVTWRDKERLHPIFGS